jgi:GT2 family glycosyltransferase
VLCDDGSTDGTFDFVKKNFPEVVLLKGDGNLWWSGATNLGVKYALSACKEHDLILALNNDVVIAPDYLQTLVDVHFLHPDAIIGSIAVYLDSRKKVAYAGTRFNKYLAKGRSKIAPGTPLNEVVDDVLDSDTLPGRGMLIPYQVFGRIGLFDEKRLPQYGADYDFSIRAKKAGYKLLVSCRAVVYADMKNEGYGSKLQEITLKSFFISHFHRKSPRNIACRFWMAVKHIPWFYLPIYFILSELRVTGSFIRAYWTERISGKRP